MILTMIISLFSSILLGLGPCNSNCVALDQENTVQQVEVKKRSNYFDVYTDSTDTYYRYSLSALLSESYWRNMVASFNSSGNMVIPNGDGSNYTYNDLLNDPNKVYQMSSSLYSRFQFYYMGNNSLVSIPISSNNCFTSVALYCANSSYSMKVFYLHLYYTRAGSTGDVLISTLYNPVIDSYNTTYTINGTSVPVSFCFAFPVSENPLALQEGTKNSFDNGYNSGFYSGYDTGYDEGYDQGYERATEVALDPISDTYQTIYNAGKQVGRSEGIAEASANSGVPALIFTGILNVALLPVDIFLQMFQYEVFGINIAGLISGLLTVCMVIVIIRFLFGGKSGGNNP